MATVQWYLVNGVDANGWQAMSTTLQTAATTNAGWVVGTGATFSAELQANQERASTTFVANTVPDGTLDTSLKDAFRAPLLAGGGTFAAGNWTFQFTVQSPTQGGAADGQIVFRLIKANVDGSSATEITSAQQSASVVTNATSSDLSSTLTFNPGAITLTATQYLFIQIAWKRTGAGGMTTTNIRLRTGSSTTVGTSILTTDFVGADQAVTGPTRVAAAVLNPPTVIQPTLIRLTSTGKVRVGPAPTIAITMPSTPTVGNGAVVLLNGYTAGSKTFLQGDVVDNWGNFYTLVGYRRVNTNGSYATAIYYCSKIAATGSPFTITCTGLAGDYFVGSAFEVGGLGTGGLGATTFQSASSGTTSTAVTSGVTTSVTGEALIVANLVKYQTTASIVVEASPVWTEEFEELDGTNWVPSEGDSRIAFMAGTTSANWTLGTTGFAAAMIAVLQKVAAPTSISGVTIASGAILRAATVVGGMFTQTITTAFVSSAAVLNKPTIDGGTVTLPPAVDLSTGIRAYWTFDETTGNAIDMVGGNPLIATNGPGTGTGIINGGRICDRAANSFFITPRVPVTSLPLTVSLWFKPADVTTNQNLLGAGTIGGNVNTWGVYVNGSHLRFFASNPSSTFVDMGGTSTLVIGTMYHVLLVWTSPTDYKIYLNGAVEITGTSDPGTVFSGQNRLAVGTYSAGVTGDTISAMVDEHGWWAVAFTTDQIAAIYNSGAGQPFTQIVASGTTATDTFDRADNSTLGVNWTNTTNSVKILGNEACGGTHGVDCFAYRSAETFDATTHASEATFRQHGAFGGDTISSLTVRHQSNGDCYVMTAFSVPGDRRLSLYKYISGALIGLADLATGAPSDGEVYKFEVSGTTLRVYKNGVQQGSNFTDSTLTGGAPGLGHFYNPAEWDNWTGYGLSGGAPPVQTIIGATIASTAVLSVPSVSGGGGGGSSTATDNFNRADSSNLGANWTNTTAGLEIISNEVGLQFASNGTDHFAYRSAETFNDDQASEATVRLHGVSGGDTISYLTCRHKSNGDFYALQVHSVPGDRRLSAVKRISGVYTGLGDFGGNVPVEGDVYKFDVTGSSLKAFKNGVQFGSTITDTSIPSGGAPGLGMFYISRWDDWTGYGVAGGSLQSIAGATVASTAVLNVPVVVALVVGDQTVTGASVASTVVAYSPAVFPAQDLTASLVGQWPMNESGGTATALDVKGTSPLVYHDNGGGSAGQTPIDGTPARDLEHDALAYFRTAVSTALASSTDQAFTVMMRFRLESFGGWAYFTNSAMFEVWLDGNNLQLSVYATSTAGFVNTTLTPVLGSTYVLAFGHDPVGNTVWMRVNNLTRVSTAHTAGTAQNIAPIFSIGDPDTLDGAVGPVSYWNRSLSDAEMDYWIGVKGDYVKIGGSAGGADQSVSGATIASTQQLFAPTVAPGAITVLLPAITPQIQSINLDDTFARANETTLGAPWATATINNANGLALVSSAVTTPSTTPWTGSSYFTTPDPANFSRSIKINTFSADLGTSVDLEMLVSPTAAPKNGFVVHLQQFGGVVYMYLSRLDAGVGTSLIAFTVVGVEDGGAFGIKRIGTTIEGWWKQRLGVDWVRLGIVTDAAYPGSLYPTITVTNASNFATTRLIVDNFGTCPFIVGGGSSFAFEPTVVLGPALVATPTISSTAVLFTPTIIPLSTDHFNVGGSQPWTLVVRCKFESQPTSMGVALKLKSGTNAFGHWGIYWNNTDGFVARVRTASQEVLAKATAHATLTLGATYVVAAGYDPSTTTVWVRVNNETRISVSVTGSTMDTSDAFLIGAALQTVGVQWPLDGAIGPVTYLKRVLSDPEIDHWIAVKGDYASITGTGLTMLM